MACSRTDWAARVLRFTDMMLERLSESWQEKDVDEKETCSLGNMIVKMVRLWDKALATSSSRVATEAPEENSREG